MAPTLTSLSFPTLFSDAPGVTKFWSNSFGGDGCTVPRDPHQSVFNDVQCSSSSSWSSSAIAKASENHSCSKTKNVKRKAAQRTKTTPILEVLRPFKSEPRSASPKKINSSFNYHPHPTKRDPKTDPTKSSKLLQHPNIPKKTSPTLSILDSFQLLLACCLDFTGGEWFDVNSLCLLRIDCIVLCVNIHVTYTLYTKNMHIIYVLYTNTICVIYAKSEATPSKT